MILPKSNAFILLAIFVGEIGGTINENKDDDCMVEHLNIICEHSIPVVVPSSISGVFIKDYLQDKVSHVTFAHNSWSTVDFLDITVNHEVDFSLHDKNIFPTNLQNLGIHSPRFEFKNNTSNVLEGLARLHTLNLSSCHNLNALATVKMLRTLFTLDTLVMDQVATSGGRLLIIDNMFLKTISMKKVHRLSMSGCNLMIKSPFHITYPPLVLYNLDISNTSIVKFGDVNFEEHSNLVLPVNLKILDISHMQNRFMDIDYGYIEAMILNNGCDEKYGLFKYFIKMEHLKINTIFSKIFRANNSFINLSQCKINLKSLQVRSNNIHYLNVSILWPDAIHLYEIDLSSNGLEYLSPLFLGFIESLEILKLSGNKLYHMESLNEFKYLFTKHKNLKHLNLSKNHLTTIPFKMFTYNINLTMLDLSYNKLSTISFDIKHLVKLQLLNIRSNDIYHIKSDHLISLKHFLAHSFTDLRIHLDDNPLICKCESSQYIKWLHVYMTNTYNRSITCSFNGKDDVVINNTVIEETEFSCIRSKIIIASITTAFLIVLFVSIATAFMFHKKLQQKKLRKRGNFLNDFKLGNLPEKYLCFASYSSDDDAAGIKQINDLIRQLLQEIIHTDKEVLCDSNEHFNLGFPIIDEIMRCIVECCVGIFYVTTNFCQSHWCQLELRETYELNKPLILIFKEEIDERNMSPLMLKIFRKFTRAKIIVGEDGQIQMIPGVKQISNSIIKLASLRYDEDIENT